MEVKCKKCNKLFLKTGQNHFFCSKDCRFPHCNECGKLLINEYALFCNKCARKKERNHNWTGKKVGYNALHSWVRRNYPNPKFCEICKVSTSYDLCNISGKYKRDIKDWFWACRKCHMLSDGRLNKLKQFSIDKKLKILYKKCEMCGSDYKTNIIARRFCGKICANRNNAKKLVVL